MTKNKSYEIEVENWVWYVSVLYLLISILAKASWVMILLFLMWMANIKLKEIKE